jgi:large conductance mechanosensitive channel
VAQSRSAWGEFKDFITRGSVLELAIAVVLAMFFGAVIKDVVTLVLNVLAIFGKHTAFENLAFHIRGGTFRYGQLFADIITFVLVAAIIFFLIVRPVNAMVERRRRTSDAESSERPCPECLSQIPKAATRCAFCTAPVPVVT